MDTNLLDSCKEARCEIDGAQNATKAQRDSDDYAKVLFYIIIITSW